MEAKCAAAQILHKASPWLIRKAKPAPKGGFCASSPTGRSIFSLNSLSEFAHSQSRLPSRDANLPALGRFADCKNILTLALPFFGELKKELLAAGLLPLWHGAGRHPCHRRAQPHHVQRKGAAGLPPQRYGAGVVRLRGKVL